VIVRDATEADAAACAAIYAPYVIATSVSFEVEPPTPEQMALRIARARDRHAWLVLEVDGEVAGYAYGQPGRTALSEQKGGTRVNPRAATPRTSPRIPLV
jgi:L-amino acid N-acyltransferase YncA